MLHCHTSNPGSVPVRSEARRCVEDSMLVASVCNKGRHFQISCGGGGVVWYFIKIKKVNNL